MSAPSLNAIAQLPRRKPGLLVTATDTEVGKTVITCAIAAALREAGQRVGVIKPMASGCRTVDGVLVSEDAQALAAFASEPGDQAAVSPVRFAAPLSPAVAAEQEGVDIDWSAITEQLARLDANCDVVLVEGVGGLFAPIDGTRTVLDLAIALGYPTLIVARSVLGTLNHTAMTARLLRDAGLPAVGIVMNSYDAGLATDDPSVTSNRDWLERMTDLPVLAVTPRCAAADVQPAQGKLPAEVLAPIAAVDWSKLIAVPQTG